MAKIASTFGLNPPSVSDQSKFNKILDSFSNYAGCEELKTIVEKSSAPYAHIFDIPAILGVEIEVEGIVQDLPMPNNLWVCKIDASLRNHGKEFTTPPLDPKKTIQSLAALWYVMDKFGAKSPDFSWRTSTHVHLNMCDLDSDEFRQFMLLSFLFEDMLFEFVGRDRKDSIFCVPLTECDYAPFRKLIQKKFSVAEVQKNWSKYSAVNLTRLKDLGTVEFRHMGGTPQLKKLMQWVSMLTQLYKAAITMSPEHLKDKIMELNTSSKYMYFVHEVFTPEVANKLNVDDFEKLFNQTISKAKEILVSKDTEKLLFKKNSGLAEFTRDEIEANRKQVEALAKKASKPVW